MWQGMSKVKKDDKTREKVKAYLATGKSKNWIAKKLNISWDTVNRISKESPDEIANLREQKKQEFINKIWEDMESALALGRQKIKLATVATETFQEKIDRLIELLEDNEETNGKDIIELIKALSSITSIPLSHISTYFGTLYDKQALMSGEATGRNEITGKNGEPLTIKFEGELEKWSR